MMKRIILYSLLFVLTISCSGSDTYRGKWLAMTPKGDKAIIIFKQNKMIITKGSKKSEIYDYHQNSYKFEVSSKAYGIKLNTNEVYQINFPRGNNERVGLILDENDRIIYAISRGHYIKPEDIL